MGVRAALKTILYYVLVLFDLYFYWVAFPYILLFETLGFKFNVILCWLSPFWLLFLIPPAFLNLATLQLFFDLYRALPTSLSPMVSYLFIRCTMNFSQDMQNFSEVIKKLRWNVRYVTVNGWQLVVFEIMDFSNISKNYCVIARAILMTFEWHLQIISKYIAYMWLY